jgi:hypothetical protein
MKEMLERRVRILLVFVICGLVVSGVTAIPIEAEINWLTRALGAGPNARPEDSTGILNWLLTVRDAVSATARQYPFLFYGTDWLAFAHFAIAVAFLGPLRDPVRNSWVVTFGLIASAGVIVFAMIAGWARGIPLYWRVIDSLFGIGAGVPLLICRRSIRRLEELRGAASGGGRE